MKHSIILGEYCQPVDNNNFETIFDRISGGMASTKDITSHVTANMRKHLAKQKWKVR